MPTLPRCGDLVPGCPAVVEGKAGAEVVAKAAEHANEPGLGTIPPDVAAKAQAAIRNT